MKNHKTVIESMSTNKVKTDYPCKYLAYVFFQYHLFFNTKKNR